ncbi:hypothetical protein SAMN05192556_101141 [Halomonas caseinilytica]|uniref:2',3'-cyclic-nucleotide 2'-phosphodiesterase/5'-or 3'-nucleotidase, 5'-nucleotidase family n=2 Tax=Halomonas caseinilytica TaxID=438744 RepID=A0A1M6MS00_9GAMM|nr:hypothetical protein SAMN05192556_101141 [Halomonas caseinilytica]
MEIPARAPWRKRLRLNDIMTDSSQEHRSPSHPSALQDASPATLSDHGHFRRRFLGLGGALAASGLSGCATGISRSGASAPRHGLPDQSGPTLLLYADVLDAHQPEYPATPATRLGPAAALGKAPWATGRSLESLSGITTDATRALTRPALAQRPVGGSSALAATLWDLRRRLPADSLLTLENGQCWNGGGLGYLTQGDSGVTLSQWLDADVRVSSDERHLWPDRIAGLYRRFARPVVGCLDDDRNPEGLVTDFTLFERGGARLAVVGASDPHATDEPRNLDDWFHAIRTASQSAREQADLVIILADTGSGPARWLAERLDAADLIVAARGQDFWPTLVEVERHGGDTVPLCFPGSRAMGVFQIACHARHGRWHFESRFVLADPSPRDADVAAQLAEQQHQLRTLRAPYSDWLDRPLTIAPDWLWRRDTTGGSWDALIVSALRESAGEQAIALAPGLRHDRRVAPGEAITRDHLLTLSGGHPGAITRRDADNAALHGLLERAADACFGTPMLLDTSQDLPRLAGIGWRCRYSRETGQRIKLQGRVQGPVVTWLPEASSQAGPPLWQLLEEYLSSTGLASLPPRPGAELSFVEGHPGWHPEQRPTS